MKIEFTEFVRPHGREKVFNIEVNDAVKAGYEAMVKTGGRLTLEHLGNGTIALCLEKPGEFDYATATVQNHTRHVSKGFKEMLQAFDADAFESRSE